MIKSTKKNPRNYTDPHGPRYAELKLHNMNETCEQKSLKIISYNIKFSKKIKEALDLLSSHQDLTGSDVICLQEMSIAGVEKIAHALKLNYVYYPAVLHPLPNKDFGNAILSKWPLSDDKKIVLPQISTKKLQRIAVRASIHFQKKKVMIFSVHMRVILKALHRQNQMLFLLKSLPENIDHCIVAGDFNTFTKRSYEAVHAPFHESNFVNSTQDIGHSYIQNYLFNKKSHIDHIFIKGLIPLTSGCVEDLTGSDHYPIWSNVKLSK